MRSVAQRVLDGIGLQLSNASLARQLSEALQLVQREAETDSLTGQPNRRALDELLKQQINVAQLAGRAFSVLLLDIDHFKLVNDTHVVLPGTMLVAALEVAERLRQGVADASLMSVPLVRATVSIGAARHRIGETAEQLLARADSAVYAAKRGGRNQVRVPAETAPT